MAEHSRFFDSLNPLDPDRVYTAEEFVGYFGKLITDGVMKGEANMLKVSTTGSNMNTTVDTGTAFLLAREYENDSKLSLTHEVEALGKSRIDRVVIRLMLNVDYREARAFVKRGVAGSSPIAPPLERSGDVYEISLAQVRITGGQTYINTVDVTNERGKVDICPWAGSKILPNVSGIEDIITLEGPYSLTFQPGGLGEILCGKFMNGMVWISVKLSGTTIPKAGLITTLPQGYAPKNDVILSLTTAHTTLPTQSAGFAVFINSLGEIRMFNSEPAYPVSGNSYTHMSDVVFLANPTT